MGCKTIAIVGGRKACSKSRTFGKRNPVGFIQAAFPGLTVVDADAKENVKAYNKFRGVGTTWPRINGFDANNRFLWEFDPYRLTNDQIIAKIGSQCGGASTPVPTPTPTPIPAKSKLCPLCKGTGYIRAAWVLAVFLVFCLTGCTATMVRVKDGDWNVYRVSLLQRVANQRITVNGVGSMEGYANDGGADLIGQLIALGVQAAAKLQGIPVAPKAAPVADGPNGDGALP